MGLIFGFEIGVKFFEISSHINKIAIDNRIMLESIVMLHLFMNFEATGVSIAFIIIKLYLNI